MENYALRGGGVTGDAVICTKYRQYLPQKQKKTLDQWRVFTGAIWAPFLYTVVCATFVFSIETIAVSGRCRLHRSMPELVEWLFGPEQKKRKKKAVTTRLAKGRLPNTSPRTTAGTSHTTGEHLPRNLVSSGNRLPVPSVSVLVRLFSQYTTHITRNRWLATVWACYIFRVFIIIILYVLFGGLTA